MLPNILEAVEAIKKNIHHWFMSWYACLVSHAYIVRTHYLQFLYFFLFSLVRLAVLIGQEIRWSRNGLGEKLRRAKQGLAYEESAQVMDVHWACKATPTDKIRLSQFICTHHELTHPKCVLADDCLLTEVTPDHATFMQLRKPLIEYSARTTTFLWYRIIETEAKRIIVMPLTSLERLSIELGPPENDGVNLTFLWGSGRCGSTLIAKMIDAADPDALVLSEPPVIMDLLFYKHRMRPRQYARFFECAARLLVKPVSGRKKIFIKPIFFVLNTAENFNETFPNARMFYSYRKPLRTVWSHERAFGITPYFQMMKFVLFTKQWEWGERLIGFQRYPPIDRVLNPIFHTTMFEMCTIIWADNYISYLLQAKKFHFPAILYERLFDNAYQFCSDVLSFCGVDSSRIHYAIDLLSNDSQEGSLFCQSILKGLPVTPFESALKSRIDLFCDRLNLPRFEYDAPINRLNRFSCDSSASTSSTMDTGENGYSFITESGQTAYEIMHAGLGGAPIANKSSSNQQNIANRLQKRTPMRPYYKPLPLQIIFSKD